MIRAYHIILPMYGFWLPNDPRGSWSDYVRKWELSCFGKARASRDRKSNLELTEPEVENRQAAIESLQFPEVILNGHQALSIANGFRKKASRSNYTIWACAILPRHTHLVVARHCYKAEQVANLLKGAATREIVADKRHPLEGYLCPVKKKVPSMWASKKWIVYLDSEEAIEQAIAYVEENPVKDGMPKQDWSFVTPFAGLPKGWITYH